MVPMCLTLSAQITVPTCFALDFPQKKCLWTEFILEQARNLTKLGFHREGGKFPAC